MANSSTVETVREGDATVVVPHGARLQKVTYPNGDRVWVKGNRVLADETDISRARAARFAEFARLNSAKIDRIGFVGGGWCVGPKLVSPLGSPIVVFEIDPDIASRSTNAKWTTVVGDYHDTLGAYVTTNGAFKVLWYDVDPADDPVRDDALLTTAVGGVAANVFIL